MVSQVAGLVTCGRKQEKMGGIDVVPPGDRTPSFTHAVDLSESEVLEWYPPCFTGVTLLKGSSEISKVSKS